MKLRATVLIVFVAALAAALIFWPDKENQLESLRYQKKLIAKAASVEGNEDLDARSRWEFNRLHSPLSKAIPQGIRGKELAFAGTLPVKERLKGQTLAKGQTLTWTKRGPRNVGGRTRALAHDVSAANTLLAGGVSGGMWRSTDDGASWIKTSDASHLHNVTCLAQDTKAGQTATWYYGTGEYLGNSAAGGGASAYLSGDGVYKSTNSGTSWSKLAATATDNPQSFDSFFDYVWKIVVDTSSSPSKVYAATYSRIYRSTDGGGSWTTVLTTGPGASSPAYASYTDVAVTSAGVVYASFSYNTGANKGILRSPTGASGTFVNITPAGFPTNYSRPVITLAPSNQNVLYLLLQGTNGTEGVDQINGHQIWKYTYGSGDGAGANGTWVNKGASLPNEAYTGVYKTTAVFDSQGGYDLNVTVKPDNENFVIIGAVNLYKTADFSVTTPTWTRMGGYNAPNTFAPYANHHPDQHSATFKPGSNVIFYSGHDGGITRTADVTASTVVWSVLNNDYVTSQFYTIAIDHATSGNSEIAGGTQDNGTWWTNSSNPAVNWIDQFSGDGAYAAIADGRTSYYFSSQNGNTYRVLMDGVGNWTDYANVAPTGGTGYQFINPFALDPNNTNMMYLSAGTTIWRNSDLTGISTFNSVGTAAQNSTSTNWTQMANTNVAGDPIVSLALSRSAANRLYYATYFFDGITESAALYRVDGANSGDPTPTDVTGASFPAAFVSCIAINPTDADEVLAVFSNYEVPSLFHTTDGGTNWTDVSGNLEQNANGSGNGPSCRWGAVVATAAGTTYFVATSTGLYSTTTLNGASTVWAQEGATTIGNVVCDMIDFRTSDGLVVVGTHANGVFSTNVVVSAPRVENTLPTDYALSQNYPNPFNPSTTIRYLLPERAHVRIGVYDAAGREVLILREREENAGEHEVRWNAKDTRGNSVSSGVYFYTLTAMGEGNETRFTRTQKMTLVK